MDCDIIHIALKRQRQLRQLRQLNERIIPAKAGIQGSYKIPLSTYWIPAFAGMTRSLHLYTSSANKDSTRGFMLRVTRYRRI